MVEGSSGTLAREVDIVEVPFFLVEQYRCSRWQRAEGKSKEKTGGPRTAPGYGREGGQRRMVLLSYDWQHEITVDGGCQ